MSLAPVEFTLPSSFCWLTWGVAAGPAPLRLAVVARRAESGGGEPHVARVFPGGRVYLAALLDGAERAADWFELWVQVPHELADSPAARGGLVGNALLDRTWENSIAALRALDPASVLDVAWGAGPWAVNRAADRIERLVHRASGRPLELCRDEAALAGAKRASYASSLEREFRVADPAGATVAWLKRAEFAALAAGGPVAAESDPAAPLGEFNSADGTMVLRRLRPVSLPGFADALRGAESKAGEPADEDPAVALERAALAVPVGGVATERFFAEDPVIEAVFLRLQLWYGAATAVRDAARRIGTPFFNLSAESFRVARTGAGAALPAAWSFSVALAQPADAVTLPPGADGQPQFVPSGLNPVSPYAIAKFGGWREGSGTVRLTQVIESADGRCRLDGFIDSNDLRGAGADEGSTVWLQLPLDGAAVTVPATLEPEQGGVRAGLRFKAVDVALPPGTAARLKTASTPRRTCRFTLLHAVHPAYDVHLLGTVGVRIFLTESDDAVPDFVEDLFELASLLPHQCSLEEIGKLAGTPGINERLLRLLALPEWAAPVSGSGGLPLTLWHAIVRELMEFTAVEELEQAEAIGERVAPCEPPWLGVLDRRCEALGRLAVHTRGLLAAPRPAHEELARIVHRFVRSGKSAE